MQNQIEKWTEHKFNEIFLQFSIIFFATVDDFSKFRNDLGGLYFEKSDQIWKNLSEKQKTFLVFNPLLYGACFQKPKTQILGETATHH